MTIRSLLLFITALSVSLAGCGGNVSYTVDHPEIYTVTLWVQDDADLPLRAVMDGCENWRPKGAVCGVTSDPAAASVRIYKDASPCVANSDGSGYVLAWANADRTVHFRGACFSHDAAGNIDQHDVSAVIGHEIGHELGIWPHVPETCDGTHLVHPEGGPVCGQALMNAYYDPTVYFVTAMDDLAFDLRDRTQSVAPEDFSGPASSDTPTCTLLRRP